MSSRVQRRLWIYGPTMEHLSTGMQANASDVARRRCGPWSLQSDPRDPDRAHGVMSGVWSWSPALCVRWVRVLRSGPLYRHCYGSLPPRTWRQHLPRRRRFLRSPSPPFSFFLTSFLICSDRTMAMTAVFQSLVSSTNVINQTHRDFTDFNAGGKQSQAAG